MEKKNIVLSDEEINAIELQRNEIKAIEAFKSEYNALVNKTGYAWVVDTNSRLNNPLIGIAKVKV